MGKRMGILDNIWIGDTAGGALVAKQQAILDAGKGIVGDRYYSENGNGHGQGTFSEQLQGTPDFEVTLIEQEEIDAFNQVTGHQYTARDFRRNLVTRDVHLNELVGHEFYVGTTLLKGVRLCEPCAYLAGILGKDIMQHMVHKAGLRAQIIRGGTIAVGDTLQP